MMSLLLPSTAPVSRRILHASNSGTRVFVKSGGVAFENRRTLKRHHPAQFASATCWRRVASDSHRFQVLFVLPDQPVALTARLLQQGAQTGGAL